jgi:hydrogenase/urease accessory protein HupE
MMIFIGVLGLFVAYVSAGPDLLWLTVGTIAGVVAGYFVGRSMDNAAKSK